MRQIIYRAPLLSRLDYDYKKLYAYKNLIVCVNHSVVSVQLFVTPWTVAHQAPLSMEFSRQEYWSGLPFLSPEKPYRLFTN